MKFSALTPPARTCVRCGAKVHLEAAGIQCVSCLLRLGLKVAPEPEDDRDASDFSRPRAAAWPKLSNYRLLREIGEGGSAVVFAAEQISPVRREVAVKIIKPGMDTKGVLRRFLSEKQVLAVMDHPNIAKVFDAGNTEGGHAFFAMELVPGIPLTDYCDWKSLSLRQRIELFIGVCLAVQHAHQKGVIHRDLKPTNILVTTQEGAPAPKIIDFGIAKATSPDGGADPTLFTAFELAMGTPAYMSPEQAALGTSEIDTRSDIYSLGVVLYELLTGSLPFARDGGSPEKLRRKIREDQPPRMPSRFRAQPAADQRKGARRRDTEPRKLARLLEGDLDWIVLRALEKDPARRFSSAAGLAGDLRRYLASEPVQARPPSALYQFGRFARRNKAALFTTVGILLAVLAAAVVSTWQAVRARRAEQRAVTEAHKSEEVAAFLGNMLHSVQPAVARGEDTTLLRRILDQTSDRIELELRDSIESRARLRNLIGWTYHKIGEHAKAEENMRESVRLYRNLPERPVGLAGSLNQLAQILWRHDPEAAKQSAREAFLLQMQIPATLDPQGKQGLATYNVTLVRMLVAEDRFEEAREICETWLAFQRQVLGEGHPAIAWTLIHLGRIAKRQGHLEEAERLYRESLAIREQFYGGEHLTMSNSLRHLGDILYARERFSEAEALLRKALEIDRKFLGEDHGDLVLPLISLGDIKRRQGDLVEAGRLVRQALALSPHCPEHRVGSVMGAADRLVNTLRERGEMDMADLLGRDAAAVRNQFAGMEASSLEE